MDDEAGQFTAGKPGASRANRGVHVNLLPDRETGDDEPAISCFTKNSRTELARFSGKVMFIASIPTLSV
jgi:hypothetical protein